jgi:hypothetical protein
MHAEPFLLAQLRVATLQTIACARLNELAAQQCRQLCCEWGALATSDEKMVIQVDDSGSKFDFDRLNVWLLTLGIVI